MIYVTPEVELHRRQPGYYVTSDEKYAIVQTEDRGPRGGKIVWWEIAVIERYRSGRTQLVIDGYAPNRTLAKAIVRLRIDYYDKEERRGHL